MQQPPSSPPQNLTQLKITTLIQNLHNNPPFKQNQQPKPNPISSRITQFKSHLSDKYHEYHQKISSNNHIINQLQKSIKQNFQTPQKNTSSIHHLQNILDIQLNFQQFYGSLQTQKDQLHKYLNNKILQLKLQKKQYDQKLKHQLQYTKNQLLKNSLSSLKKYQSTSIDQLPISIKLTSQLKTLKHEIQKDILQNKQYLKTMKNTTLKVCQNIQNTLVKQQQILDQTFKLHFQTLSKLIFQVSDQPA